MSDDYDEINISQCAVGHDEENSIKSKAIVKCQMVKSPASYARLQCNTDLNIPPTNWLNSSINSYGLQQALSQSTGFTSFRMAHLFPDCVGEVDVVSSAENIKRLLKLPYSPNSTISMMVHRIENTLLIDEFDLHKYLLRKANDDWEWLRSFIRDNIVSSLGDTDRNVYLTNNSLEATQQRSLLSKFLYHSLSRTEEGSTGSSPEKASLEGEESNDRILQPPLQLTGPLLPEPSIEDVPDPEHTRHNYNRNILWNFEDIRMLLGTDIPIFGGNSRPCISLRLRDMGQPINVLTGIDYWLDNLMCNVPEVVMCYHLDGLVQKYEIIKTEDLPYLEDSKFSPKVIRNVAQNILSFLKQNATKAGHTYWLFKGRNDDVVKLYDLTSLCTNTEDGSAATTAAAATAASGLAEDQKGDKNPFTVPVAMLLYKVARNMKNSSQSISAKQAGSIKALLDNCIKLLPKEVYPQIVTSSYYLLSDLHIPTGTDPTSPNFFDDSASDTQSVYDDFESTCNGSVSEENFGENEYSLESIAVKSIHDTLGEFNLEKNWKHNSSPPPISGSVDERCEVALEYIANGLNCLQYFSSNEEKLAKEKEDIAKQQEKIRIIHEELHPNMAKPYLAIPLPYEKLKADAEQADVQVSVTQRTKKSKRNRKTSATQGKSGKRPDESESIDHSLLPKYQPGGIQSWNIHLKILLLEKACLIYATLTEQAYLAGYYGTALRYISLAMKCQQIVTKHMSSISSQNICLLGRAGDCYFQCSENVAAVQTYAEEFNSERDVDQAIMRELVKDLEAIPSGTELAAPKGSVEQLILTSISCYEAALEYSKGNSTTELIGRLGSTRNELGVKYMHWAQAKHQQMKEDSAKGKVTEEPVEDASKSESSYMELAMKSYDCLIRGIAAFEEIGDNANLAILLCNMGRFMRFRAHLDQSNDASFAFKKKCYESAFVHYHRGLAILESRKRNPNQWDFVSWELCTSKFTLAQHIHDCVKEVLNEELEQEIIELLLNALKLCDTETPGPRQILYLVRSGLIHRRLGQIYFNAMKTDGSLNDTRKKKLLQLSRLYYEKAAKTFEAIDAHSEFLNVLSDRLLLQDYLCEATQNSTQKWRHLQTALNLLQNSTEFLDSIAKLDSFTDDIEPALKRLETLAQNLLKQMFKMCLTRQSGQKVTGAYKALYGKTLRPSGAMDAPKLAEHLTVILKGAAHLPN